MPDEAPLRIGFVPEHFSTPLHYAAARFGLSASLIPFPSGTGHMISALRAGEIDVGIGLTEAWIAGRATPASSSPKQAGYALVGTYVETPLCWAILTGRDRRDVRVDDLRGTRLAVSRIGSGSYVMAYVLAAQQGWLSSGEAYATVTPHQTFAALRAAVNDPAVADVCMWEHFTSKRYYATDQATPDEQAAAGGDTVTKIGEIYTPWPSWHIVAADPHDPRLPAMFTAINQGIAYFEAHPDENVAYISTALDYTADDAREWLTTVRFAKETTGVRPAVVHDTLHALETAGVSVHKDEDVTDMIGIERKA